MKGLHIITFLFIILHSIAFSQDAVDPKAMALLDKSTSSFNQSSKSSKIDFSCIVENTQSGKKQNLKGYLLLKGEKFKLSVAGVDTYFDGKTEYVYMPESAEVTVSEPGKEEVKKINPILIITSYKSGYKMLYIGETTDNGNAVEIAELYPEDRKSPYARISISVDKSSMKPHAIKLQGKSGVNTTITVDKYSDMSIDDRQFAFDLTRKDIEIIDLR
ncbi:MAG: outer membrane lipoprotein carrier protein LolA [Paludibacteraceae bacterium]|nr:outer membrane lipoprotein carrier protein LolA [Paludibacteraceae bacterium]